MAASSTMGMSAKEDASEVVGIAWEKIKEDANNRINDVPSNIIRRSRDAVPAGTY